VIVGELVEDSAVDVDSLSRDMVLGGEEAPVAGMRNMVVGVEGNLNHWDNWDKYQNLE
jgi:hypothetical protein